MQATLRARVTWGIGALLVVMLLSGLLQWNRNRERQATRHQAELLLAPLAPDSQVTAAEYSAWKQIAAAAPGVRVEVARLPQDRKYAPQLFNSDEIVAKTTIGFDYDGTVSRALVEQLVCAPLESAAATAANDVPLYLVPWLNPAALDSTRCAEILTQRVISADPGSFLQGAQLLALVLGQLPVEQARPHITALVTQTAVAPPAAVEVLFSALRHVDSATWPAEFATALQTLTQRISATEGSTDIANLFDSIDFLKYSVSPEQLVPVMEAAIARMLERRDSVLTHALYFTLADLKMSHHETSFGTRADYLMRGINLYSDALEIYDYSRVLRLDDQFATTPGHESALAAALLSEAQDLAEEDYVSSIWPYCQRFLEISDALGYEDFLAGARVMFAQARNARFLFSRPCLLDSRLVARIDAADRPEFVAVVISALTGLGETGSARTARRVAENLELLGLLKTPLDPDQLAQVSALVKAAVTSEDDNYPVESIMRALNGAADVNFPPAFYSELFVLLNSGAADAAPPGASNLVLQKMPEAQRAYIVNTAVATFVAPQTDAAALAAQAERLMVAMRPWIPADALPSVLSTLAAAIEDPQDIQTLPQLARALAVLNRQPSPQSMAAHAAVLRHIAASEQRAQLGALFQAISILGMPYTTNGADKDILRAAIVRFLEQIVPEDADVATVRSLLGRPASAAPTRAGTTRKTRDYDRVALEPTDVEHLSTRFIHALANEQAAHPIADYTLSIEMLARYARPGALDNLLYALQQRLDSVTTPAEQQILVSTWLAVEASTNKELDPAQRIPRYLELLQLPLLSASSRALLVDEAGKIAEQEFGGDMWQLVAWAQSAGLLDTTRQN